jgi:CRP/FNR family transcriptional regulator, cyclic AMP receptor protein
VHASNFLDLLTGRDREALLRTSRPQAFKSGATLCMQGEPSTHVFILVSGWVKVISVTRDGREMLENLRGAGDIVGEIAGQVTGYRTATIRAIGAVRALIVGTRQFGEFLDTHPGAAQAHRRVMAEQQRVVSEERRRQALASGPQRLARLLLDLVARSGEAAETSLTAPLPLSQEEIASLIGTSRSTVTRALQDWRSRQIIRTGQRKITILDPARLLRIAAPDAPQEGGPGSRRAHEQCP